MSLSSFIPAADPLQQTLSIQHNIRLGPATARQAALRISAGAELDAPAGIGHIMGHRSRRRLRRALQLRRGRKFWTVDEFGCDALSPHKRLTLRLFVVARIPARLIVLHTDPGNRVATLAATGDCDTSAAAFAAGVRSTTVSFLDQAPRTCGTVGRMTVQRIRSSARSSK
jgi:hypothetical protein